MDYGGLFLIGNALLSMFLLIGRLYMGVFGIEFESFMVGPGLFLNMLISGAVGVISWLIANDDASWR